MRVIASHQRTATSLAAVIAATALMAACSTGSSNGESGTASPQPTATQTPDSSLPHSGAPKVESPIADVAGFEANPCSVVTAEQFRTIGLKSDEPRPNTDFAAGSGCDWFFEPIDVGTINGSFMKANSEGLSNLYAKDKAGEWGLFEDAGIVEGYPAVFANRHDERSDGYCDIEIGLRDDLTYHVGVSASSDESPFRKDPCGAAKKVAALVIKTLKGGA